MFSDVRLETARLLKETGALTDEQFQAVQAESERQERERQAQWQRTYAETRRRYQALPWWKRFWRQEP